MFWLILALFIGVVLAAVVVGLVAVPAHREGRTLLTEHGENVVSGLADRTDKVGRGAAGLVSSVTRRHSESVDLDSDSGAPDSGIRGSDSGSRSHASSDAVEAADKAS